VLIVFSCVWVGSLTNYVKFFLGVCVLTLAFVGVKWWWSDRKIRLINQEERNKRANEVLKQVLDDKNPSLPYFIYLRPFLIDGQFMEGHIGQQDDAFYDEYGWVGAYEDLEFYLAALIWPHSQIVAISNKSTGSGAGYIPSDNESWQRKVRELCKYAEGIFVVPFSSEGTSWEVEMIIERGYLSKTFWVMPPQFPIVHRLVPSRLLTDFNKLWERGRAKYEMLKLPEYDWKGAVVFVCDRIRIFKGFSLEKRSMTTKTRTEDDIESLREFLTEFAAANKPS
jgi:hypothetical protein